MPGEVQTIKYISLDNMTLYTQLMKSYVDEGDAKALKTVMLSQDNRSLLFYRSTEPISDGTEPDYSITLPETNLDSCMKKVVSALSGNVGVFDANGQIIDGGIKLSDIVTTADVEQMIAEAVEKSTHITATIVDTLPSDEAAKPNIIYMLRNASATGSDVYEEYMLIDGRLTMIGDTSTNLDNYYTKQVVDDKIAAAKSEAITDAVAQAGTAADTKDQAILAEAKTYTDQATNGLQDSIDAVDAKVDAVDDRVDTLSTTVQSNTDRIVLLENDRVEINTASADEIRALFAEEESGG